MSPSCPHCGGTGLVPEPPEHIFHLAQEATLDMLRTGTITIPIDPPLKVDAGTYRVKLEGARVTLVPIDLPEQESAGS